MKLINIYFITDDVNVKIGRAKNIEKRIKQLQTSNHVKLKILYVIENMDASFEKHVHSVCQRYNISGEWFSFEAIDHLLNHPWFYKNMKKKQD